MSQYWSDITNDFLKAFVEQHKGSLMTLFLDCKDSTKRLKSWNFGLINLLPKVIFLVCCGSKNEYCKWVARISFCQSNCKSTSKCVVAIGHPIQYGFTASKNILWNISNRSGYILCQGIKLRNCNDLAKYAKGI